MPSSAPRPFGLVLGGLPEKKGAVKAKLIANIVPRSEAPVTTSKALVPSSFLLLKAMHLLLVASCS